MCDYYGTLIGSSTQEVKPAGQSGHMVEMETKPSQPSEALVRWLHHRYVVSRVAYYFTAQYLVSVVKTCLQVAHWWHMACFTELIPHIVVGRCSLNISTCPPSTDGKALPRTFSARLLRFDFFIARCYASAAYAVVCQSQFRVLLCQLNDYANNNTHQAKPMNS